MRLALAQLNVVVGDIDGNVERLTGAIAEASSVGADLVVLPELAVTGYPPEDLLLRPGFVRAAREAVDEVARACTDTVALVGAPAFERDLANAAFVCAGGEVAGVYRKHFLPNYGVFDEHRYFAAGRELLLLELGDVLVGPTICEDVWQPGPPATDLALAGATLLVNLSASPFHVGKAEDREEMLVTRARDNAVYVGFCNLVGGQDELVFDGHSVVLDDEGEVIARAPGFEEALLVVDLDPTEAIGRRLRDVRRRELERVADRPAGRDDRPARRAARGRGAHGRAAGRSVRARAGADAARPRPGPPRLRREERLRRRRDRRLRRHRLGGDGGDRGRRARRRPRAHGLDALALLVRGDARRRAGGEREPRRRVPRDPDRGGGRPRSTTRSAASRGSRRRTSRRASAARC